jgi:transcriptional regulator with XRE-family HTH domain
MTSNPAKELQQVSAWAKRFREATDRRRAAIFAAKDAGFTVQQIADACGVSHQRISKILEGSHK